MSFGNTPLKKLAMTSATAELYIQRQNRNLKKNTVNLSNDVLFSRSHLNKYAIHIAIESQLTTHPIVSNEE